MRLFFYYAFHSFKNQLRKLFKTWVFIFIAVCVLLGALIGGGAGLVAGLISDRNDESAPSESEFVPDEEIPDLPDENEGEIIEIDIDNCEEEISGGSLKDVHVRPTEPADS